MKILFLSAWYPTQKNPNFGIFVKEHAHAIHYSENEIICLAIVVHHSPKFFEKTVTDLKDEKGMRTIVIEINSKFRDFIYHCIPLQYYIVRKLISRNILPEFTPDIIHSNVVFPAGMIGNLLSKTLQKPHIITEHWSRINGILRKPILGGWALKAYQNAALILPVSLFLQKRMSDILPGIPTSKYKTIGNIIDTETFFFKPKNNHPDTIHFCAIATWAHKKTADKLPELFIEALAKWQGKIEKKVVLTMIGGGNKTEELQEICRIKGIEAVFLGYQNKKTIAKQLQSSDFLLHASTIETFGVVVAESLLCGTPVICSKVGALPELITESNGILCENHVDAWVAGLRSAYSSQFIPLNIANDIKNKYSLEAIGKQINSAYKKI